MNIQVASVVIDRSTYTFDKQYDYVLPLDTDASSLVGCRVVVPFGRSNNKRTGLVLSVKMSEDERKLKSVISVIDKTPILSDEMIKLVCYLKEHTFCTYFDAVHAVIPTGLNMHIVDAFKVIDRTMDIDGEDGAVFRYILSQKHPVTADDVGRAFGINNANEVLERLAGIGALYKESNTIRKLGDATVKTARLVDPDGEINIKLSDKQRTVVELLRDVGALSVKEITYFTGVGNVVVNNLQKYGIVELFDREVYRMPKHSFNKSLSEDIVLTKEQNKAFCKITDLLDKNKFSTALLYGVTGSGKTQVFMKSVEKCVNEGKGVIVMVPEIALTPQMLELFYSRFGDKVAVFHSALPLGQRLDEWKRVRNGDALIALGTRSAVFAPFSDLGLVIMDEEQEHTYKSEQSPRFHTRDVARFRAAYHGAVCLLASATPSIETYSAAISGKYELLRLESRYGNALLPQVIPVDMRKEFQNGNRGNISSVLAEEIDNCLNDGKQAILLLNRRGHDTYISCASCGYVATCENCSISLTYHSANNRLMCHYCGHSEPFVTKCPKCGNEHMRYSGAGTQKLEDELSMLFPKARVLRLDADTTMARNAFSDKLSAFSKGEYDILLGTQMVAKGLDFPNVTLVGVLSADSMLHSDDYRCFERTFSLLTQVVGRSGRGETPGKAYIQTLEPDNSIITLAAKQDYDAFYKDEILTRKLMKYPPYCNLVSLVFSGVYEHGVFDATNEFLNIFTSLVNSEYADVKLIVLRPTPCTVFRVSNKYRYRIIVKCNNNARTRQLFCAALDKFSLSKHSKNTTVSVNVNPDGNI